MRIASRAITPAQLNGSNDSRLLGVCLHGIELAGADGAPPHRLSPDDPGFREGIHPAERAGGQVWRWTSGTALLPPLPASDVDTVLILHGRAMPRYPASEA